MQTCLDDPLSPVELRLGAALLELMKADVIRHAPLEACGLLAGEIQGEYYIALDIIPVTNALHSPTRYRMEPGEQLAAFNQMDERGQQLLGIYHSHPNGPDRPSATDIAEAYYPEAVYLIWFAVQDEWNCQAYSIRQGLVHPVRLVILED